MMTYARAGRPGHNKGFWDSRQEAPDPADLLGTRPFLALPFLCGWLPVCFFAVPPSFVRSLALLVGPSVRRSDVIYCKGSESSCLPSFLPSFHAFSRPPFPSSLTLPSTVPPVPPECLASSTVGFYKFTVYIRSCKIKPQRLKRKVPLES